MFAFVSAAILALLISPLVIRLYKSQGWVDDPQKNLHVKKTHKGKVPRGGGLIIFLSVVLGVLLVGLNLDKHLIAILVGALVLMVVGVLDDIYDIHPSWRLLAGLVAGLIVVGSGIGIAYVSNPFGPGVIHLDQPQIPIFFLGKMRHIWVLADLFALIFIIWNMNIVNWSKGVDGQLPGFVSVAALFIGILSTRFIDDPTSFNTALLSFIVAGAYMGYLYWNWYPQKSMPGYGAGALAGYFLAVLAILSGAKLATTLMVLSIPTADAVFTIARRIRAGKSPIWGDRGHLHHKLLDVLGWGRRRIAVFYWSTSLFFGLLALYLNTWGKIISLAISFGLVFWFLIWAKQKSLKQKPKSKT